MDKGSGQEEMGKGEWVKGMESALWIMQGRRRFRVCSCFRSFCLPQELAKKWVIQLVSSSSCADQEAFLKEAGQVLSVDFPVR